jgi:uncharacterized protein (TIGR02453 family)
MNYFDKDYLEFFKELAANNHKGWFDENRKRYEDVVREPFKIFIADVIEQVHQIDSEVTIEAKDAIFRINRDVRFSKDKTPYKLFNSAIISKTGRKDKSYPGIYLELNPERLGIFGGLYMPDKDQIQKVRNYIINNNKELESILSEKEFVTSFETIKGIQYKRLPKEIQEIALEQPLLYNKQWYYEFSLPSKMILKDNLLEVIMKYYKISHPLQKFLINALQ